MAEPRGLDKSNINPIDPSGFSTAPKGEQCVIGNGGEEKGPDVCPLESSVSMADLTPSGCLLADLKLFGLEEETKPKCPTLNPTENPSRRNDARH